MRNCRKSQSSLELLITLSFGLIILLPIIAIAFLQVSSSSSSLSTTEAQQVANKLSAVASGVGSQGPPARQVVTIQVPPNVQAIYVGGINNIVGHQIIFVVNTNAGPSYVTAYVPLNVSGDLSGVESPATYLINVTAVSACPANAAVPCVFIKPQ